MNAHWFLRAARWARNPPSASRVKFVLAIIVVCIALYTIEHFVGWPDALSPDQSLRRGYRP